MSETTTVSVDRIAAEALAHAGDCIEVLTERGEPMGDHQTFRRGYNAADEFLVESPLTGDDFDAAVDIVGDSAGMALENGISGRDAAEFYRNKADSIKNND